MAAHRRLADGDLATLRSRQDVAWMWREITDTLVDRLRAAEPVRRLLPALEAAVAAGETTAASAAHEALAVFLDPSPAPS